MLEIKDVEPLEGRSVRLTLTDGTIVERDLGSLLAGGGMMRPINNDDSLFRRVFVANGTIAWPGDVDLAPETLIWDGPYPPTGADRRPAPWLRPKRPTLTPLMGDPIAGLIGRP